MNAPTDIEARILALVRRSVPSGWRGRDIAPETPLYQEGVALDSLAMIEVLLAVQEEFGIELDKEYMDGGDYTLASLADGVRRARGD